MDVSKSFFNGERNFYFEIEEGCKLLCVKLFFLADLLGNLHLFEILKTSLTVKCVKKGCFEKRLRWRAPFIYLFFFRNEGEI